jgi:hypothetical protein
MRDVIQAMGAEILSRMCKGRIKQKISYHNEELQLVYLHILCTDSAGTVAQLGMCSEI